MKSVSEKVIVVTGAGSGIGRASAELLSEQGDIVILSDIDAAAGAGTAELISERGGTAHFVQADVSKSDDVSLLMDEVISRYGKIDCAFNNAGIEGEVAVPISDASEEEWDRVINVNLKGVWLCMQQELRHMSKQGYGSIVNTASVAGLVGGTFGGAYFASKHGVVGLTKAAAIESGRNGVRVNAVCPGVIETDMAARSLGGNTAIKETIRAQYPLRRLGQASEVAQVVVWLCSDASSFVTGQAVAVDGGFVAT